MVAASIERLMVIVYPFRPKLSKNKCIVIILIIWIISTITSLPWLFILHVDDIYINNKTDSILIDYYFNDLYRLIDSKSNNTTNSQMTHDFDELIELYSLNDESSLFDDDNIIEEISNGFHSDHSKSPDSLHILYRACLSIYSNDMIFRSYLLFLFFSQYLFPMLVLCITYAVIAYYVYFANSNQQFQCHNSYLQKNRRKVEIFSMYLKKSLYFYFLNQS
jgi:hypothetical protein